MNQIKFTRNRSLVTILALIFCCGPIFAQNGGIKSSYSRFGLGLLSDQSQTWNRSMGGVGTALPSGNKLNTMNPASYAHLDSLSFILDVGMSGNFGHMARGKDQLYTINATFDYLVAGFRLCKGLGFSLGFMPYSKIDYNYTTYSTEVFRDELTSEEIRNTTNYQGTGGVNNCFIGIGWNPFSKLSIGANIGLLWGSYDHLLMQKFTQDGKAASNFDGFNFIQHANILTYKLDFGAQYAFRVSQQDWITLGATVGLGHNFDGDAYLYRYMSTGDTLRIENDKGFDLPMTYAGGVSWHHKNNLLISADCHYSLWGDCGIPQMDISNNTVAYPTKKGLYKNSYTINAGMEYTPDPMATKGYHNHMKYRFGVSYTSPYMNISQGNNIYEGPREIGVSLGFGLPITNRINSRSMVNIGLQWINRAPISRHLITENYLMLNVGVTFNERWFMKFKIQ